MDNASTLDSALSAITVKQALQKIEGADTRNLPDRLLDTFDRKSEARAMPPAGYVEIEPGDFLMGSPPSRIGRFENEVQYSVRLTRPFFFKKTPVTQNEWHEMMGNNPSYFLDDLPDDPACERPVERVSWYDAIAYCNRLSQQENLTCCYDLTACTGTPGVNYTSNYEIPFNVSASGYRLPTEAQFRWAADGGTTQAWHGALNKVAWYLDNSSQHTHAVARKLSNGYGLFDTLGNVFEWMQNKYSAIGDSGHSIAVDPMGPSIGAKRVIVGGAWNSPARCVCSAGRSRCAPSDAYPAVGFRPVRIATRT